MVLRKFNLFIFSASLAVLGSAAAAAPLLLRCLSVSGAEGLIISGAEGDGGKLVVKIRQGNYGGKPAQPLFEGSVDMHVSKGADGICNYLYSDNPAAPGTTVTLTPNQHMELSNDMAFLDTALTRLNGQNIKHSDELLCGISLSSKEAFDKLCTSLK